MQSELKEWLRNPKYNSEWWFEHLLDIVPPPDEGARNKLAAKIASECMVKFRLPKDKIIEALEMWDTYHYEGTERDVRYQQSDGSGVEAESPNGDRARHSETEVGGERYTPDAVAGTGIQDQGAEKRQGFSIRRPDQERQELHAPSYGAPLDVEW